MVLTLIFYETLIKDLLKLNENLYDSVSASLKIILWETIMLAGL